MLVENECLRSPIPQARMYQQSSKMAHVCHVHLRIHHETPCPSAVGAPRYHSGERAQHVYHSRRSRLNDLSNERRKASCQCLWKSNFKPQPGFDAKSQVTALVIPRRPLLMPCHWKVAKTCWRIKQKCFYLKGRGVLVGII